MRRLPFVLPDFTRVSWTSDAARGTWAPRLGRISEAWSEIQWLSVAAGVRRSALLRMPAASFAAHTPRWREQRVSALGLAREAAGRWSYSSSAGAAIPGQPSVVVVGLGRRADLEALRIAWDARRHETLGELLGYPACCREFFQKVWVEERHVDTTWPMALRSLDAAAGNGEPATRLEVKGLVLVNVLWRWMGVRAVPHLPCRFGCHGSAELAAQMLAAGRRAGFAQELEWLEEILAWPVQWSALHGIAEIKTPILKVSARTDATPVKYEVRLPGTRYPTEGATALRFPYRIGTRSPARSADARAGAAGPARGETGPAEWHHRDNGFASRPAMDAAHAPIVELAVATLGDQGGRMLDLGCGNGVLLGKIRARAGERLIPYGIDREPTHIDHARQFFPAFAENFWLGDLCTDDDLWRSAGPFRLAILGVPRLLESPPDRAARLRAHLREYAQHLLVYVYPSADGAPEDLAQLAARAGLRLIGPDPHARAALAEAL